MSTQRRRERERLARREQIVEAAKEVFGEKGFMAATAEEIARRAEVAVGTLYLYFKSKEEMYVSLLFEGLDLFRQELERIQGLSLAPDEKLRAFWDFLYTFYARYPAYYRIISFLHAGELREAVSRDLLEEVNRRTGRNFSLAARIVRQGMMAGLYRTGNPREVVDFLWALLNGLVQLMEIRRNLGLAVGDLAELHRNAFTLIEQGLRPPRGSAPGSRPRPAARPVKPARPAKASRARR
ncbi:MAG: TetR/AcrR family transcriptional regulator [Candidatus Rokubacteria bacterium]|nr:TetR/AcrR family transcriptional regulator [Candidatus Rokubacteria bacterium]MBI3108264.1 TetR/AcrR family transcriptional regulator [Candidatus Rokubacteria bacterium]